MSDKSYKYLFTFEMYTGGSPSGLIRVAANSEESARKKIKNTILSHPDCITLYLKDCVELLDEVKIFCEVE